MKSAWSPAKVFDHMAEPGSNRISCALSAIWLLAGLTLAGLSAAYLEAAARLGWLSPTWACANFLSRSCQSTGVTSMHDIKSGALAAIVGAALLVCRRFAIIRGGLAPAPRRIAIVVGLTIGIVSLGFGMAGRVPWLHGDVFGTIFLHFRMPVSRVPVVIGTTILFECLIATFGLTDPIRPTSE